ncbi:Cysteine-rich receptor-like protein kinase 19 [Triticum urartu]|uniref:non-specific serine/threonine protein kinase n=1 Tax=Triticum urartu TaxID=4572 RepID=M7YHJ8_TRIUA|nr:Cysteine-rich receptor-like protein kinase 19 [Triticum urartu]
MDHDQVSELEVLEGILGDASAEPFKISYGLLKTITRNFSNEIGHGSFGNVYRGGRENLPVAVKKISNVHTISDKEFMDEIKCLKSAKHKNIVRFLGYCAETDEEITPSGGTLVMAGKRIRMMCFEYVPNGNIRQYLAEGSMPKYSTITLLYLYNGGENPQGVDWPACYKIIRGICHGLNYLHDRKINHLDLKPENVMLDDQMEPKITDFGLSRFLDQGTSTMVTKHIIGTPRYIAPEIINKGHLSFKTDVYAFGIIIIELLTGKSMISLENWDESLDMDCPRRRRCAEMARQCTDFDKRNRPTMRDVITDLDKLESMHPWSSISQSPAANKRVNIDLPKMASGKGVRLSNLTDASPMTGHPMEA